MHSSLRDTPLPQHCSHSDACMQASGASALRSPRLPASALNPDFDCALPQHLALLTSTRSTSSASAEHSPASIAGYLGRPSKSGGYVQGHTSLGARPHRCARHRTGSSDPRVSVNDAARSLRATDTPHPGHVVHATSTSRGHSAPISGVAAVAAAEVVGAGGGGSLCRGHNGCAAVHQH